MADLRRLLTQAGAVDVSTYIQSGNAVFNHPAGAADVVSALEPLLQEAAGFAVPVMLRTPAELRSLVEGNPFAARGAEATKVHVLFLKEAPPVGAIDSLDPLRYEPEAFVLQGRDVYLHLPQGMGRAKLTPALLEKVLGVAGTARNWKTVTKLLELADKASELTTGREP
jgi:uncharacterized protein (DUF1697 family)